MKRPSFNIGLSKRIYIAMLALVVISSLVIALVTANFFKNQNEKYHLSRLERKEKRVANSIKFFTDKYEIEKDLNSVSREFYEKIEELSKENEMELKIYNTDGEILLSLDQELNPDDSIPSYIFNEIYASLDSFYILKKDQNKLSTYSFLKNRKGENIGILNVPDYDFSIKLL